VPLADDYAVGECSCGFYDLDALLVVCSLANAQDLFGIENAVHGLVVALREPERAAQAASGSRRPWRRLQIDLVREHASFLDSVLVEKNMMYYLLFFITLVAAFGICSGLITFVVQKTRRSGRSRRWARRAGRSCGCFWARAWSWALGVAAGFGLGVLGVTYRNEFLFLMRRLTGFELFPADIYHFYELPALIIPGDILVIASVSLVMCLLGGLIPAWHAGRLKPVEALRHE
jgi:lipoprotein-releasing system permease protein